MMPARGGQARRRRVTGLMKLNQTVLVLSTLGLMALAPLPSPAPRVARFLGPRAAQTLPAVMRAEVFRVKDKRANEGEKSVGGYVIEAAGAEQGEAFARRVAEVLLDEKSYRFDVRRVGGFKPRFGVRLSSQGRWVEVLLSPATDEVVVLSPNPADESVRSAQADIAPAREKLLALVKEAMAEE
jgi:hypothetical protein